jgi:hypothetical protein
MHTGNNMKVVALSLLTAVSCITGTATAGIWTGNESATWSVSNNWSHLASPAGVLAEFGPTATRTTVTKDGTGSSPSGITFLENALAYTFNSGEFREPGKIIVQSGVSTNQTFNTPVRYNTDVLVENDGSGTLTLGIGNSRGYRTSGRTAGFSGSGNTTLTTWNNSGEQYVITKSGTGTLRFSGNVDFQVSNPRTTLIQVSGGTLDISTATINVEDITGASDAASFSGTTTSAESRALSLQSYDLITYAGGNLTFANTRSGFATVNIPASISNQWEVVHLPASKKVVLQPIPEPASAAATIAIAAAGLVRRRRRS